MTNTHGGKRAGAGAKSKFGQPMTGILLQLPAHQVDALKILGGVRADRIREAIESYLKNQGVV